MRKSLFFLSLAALLGAPGADAQPAGQWWVLHQDVVKPGMAKPYEGYAKEFVAAIQKNRAAMPTFSFDVLVSDDFTYTYAAPIKNMAGYDQINSEFGALMQADGPAMLDLFTRMGATLEYTKEWVVGQEPELGYPPASPRVKPEEARYFQFDMYYVMPGKEPEADALAKEIAAYFKSKGIADAYNVYKPVVGPEMPLLIIEQWAKDAADFQAAQAKNLAILGDGFQALMQRAWALTRRFESRRAWSRPDLSLPAPTK